MFIMGSINSFFSSHSLETLQKSAEKSAKETAVEVIESEKNTALMLAEQATLDQDLIEALSQKDRKKIAEVVDTVYAALKMRDVTLFEVVDQDGMVAYRGHQPETYGDSKRGDSAIMSVLTRGESLSFVAEGVTGLALRGVSPVKQGGKVVGTVTIGMITDQQFVDRLKRMDGGEVGVFNADKKTLLVSTIPGEQSTLSDPTLLDAVIEQKQSYSSEGELNGVPYSFLYIPLTDFDNAKTLGVLRIAESRETLVAAEEESQFYQLLIWILVMVVCVLIAIWTTRSIMRPITSVMDGLKRASGGQLTKAKPVKASGELKMLYEHYNTMILSVSDLLAMAKETAGKVADLTETLSRGAQETSVAAEQVTQAIDAVAVGSDSQNDSLQRANDRLSTAIRSLEQIQKRASELSQRAEEVDEAVLVGRRTMDKTRTEMNSIHQQVVQTAETMNRLGKQSQRVGHIVDLIAGIAGQTNLLALNAAIEAARAGEQGRGFAVVADEVRKLAEQSGKAAEEIVTLIREMRDQVDESIEGMQQGLTAVSAGSAAVEEAEHAFGLVSSGLTVVTSEISQVHRLTDEATEEAVGVEGEFQSIAAVAEQTAASSEEVAASVEEQSATLATLSDSMNELAMLADELNKAVKRFNFEE
ncbi:methyl-accepting chemotaxis protein [Tumebacillus lipolyticus]|uniref:Methyl-accepting chemotaxis protein n=1 Tax=Tumebacillus lipolyticus TaxID=1280370 RepID=A0ABW4ZT96_9BACL